MPIRATSVYTYLTVRPSADYFGVLPFAHIDGADAQWVLPIGDLLLRTRLHGGWLNEKLPLAGPDLEPARLAHAGRQHQPAKRCVDRAPEQLATEVQPQPAH